MHLFLFRYCFFLNWTGHIVFTLFLNNTSYKYLHLWTAQVPFPQAQIHKRMPLPAVETADTGSFPRCGTAPPFWPLCILNTTVNIENQQWLYYKYTKPTVLTNTQNHTHLITLNFVSIKTKSLPLLPLSKNLSKFVTLSPFLNC